jgi:hypothetical protein
MLLDDACHSIDSLNMRAILENVKFPNYPAGPSANYRWFTDG